VAELLHGEGLVNKEEPEEGLVLRVRVFSSLYLSFLEFLNSLLIGELSNLFYNAKPLFRGVFSNLSRVFST
jgi:hypothetical protein